jgi:hypothetical protein
MSGQIVWRVAAAAALAVTLSGHGLAQAQPETKLGGVINDYTAVLDPGGPWHIVGQWSAWLKGNSGKGDFSVALSMVRADNPTRQSHTHHVWVSDGEVTQLSNGFRIDGVGTMTGNGTQAGFSGSPVSITVTGGEDVRFSNVSITFGGGATGHFGTEPLDGVVTEQR